MPLKDTEFSMEVGTVKEARKNAELESIYFKMFFPVSASLSNKSISVLDLIPLAYRHLWPIRQKYSAF